MTTLLATPLQLADLLVRARDPGSAARGTALTGTAYVLIEADATTPTPDELAVVSRWLREQGCPVIAIGHADSAVAAACDTYVPNLVGAEALVRTIEHSPLASAVLVQVLRAVERLSLEDGLLVESLAYSTLLAGPEFRRWLATHHLDPAFTAPDQGPAVVATRKDAHLDLELNRASRRNAMSMEMRDALIETLQMVAMDDSIRSVTIRGRGKCFSTGGELDEFGTAPDAVSAHLVRGVALPGRALAACADRVTARVHGACIGSGIEFPAFASRLLATPEAWFQLPELRYGLIPGAGGCVSISRRIGRQRTAWMALSGARVSASVAKAWRLLDDIEPATAD